MSDPNLMFRQAGEACERGDFAAAAALYRALQAQIPGHPQIIAGLGNAELGLEHSEEAIALFQESLAIHAAQPDVWCNLGRALRQAKRHEDALDAVDRALALVPLFFEALVCRGNIAWDLDRIETALAAYDQASALRPQDARVQLNRANALLRLKRFGEAEEAFRRALTLAPDYVEALKRYADLLVETGRREEALPVIDQALTLQPRDQKLRGLRGQVLHALLRVDEALTDLESAAALDPTSAVAQNNLGVALHIVGRLEEARAAFEYAIALDPAYADAIANLGTVTRDLGHIAEAAAFYDHALVVDPEHPDANCCKGLIALLNGDFAEGWHRYEWRWRCQGQGGSYLLTDKPQWRGEDIAGKTILLWWEQGYGDYLQFCRYVPLVCATGARVILEVPPRLRALITRLAGDFVLMDAGARETEFDVQCPLMSLPLAFGTTIDTVPSDPYLSADPEKRRLFDARLGPRPRIGLVWSANINIPYSRPRRMSPETLEPLLDLPFAFHVIQKDFRPEDVAWLERHPALSNHADAQDNFADAAALIEAMDLVVTVDTAVAHLAGALGKPVWVMLPFAADWRWLRDRSDTPWYPSMRLFRQPVPRDWRNVIAAVCDALATEFTQVSSQEPG